MDANILAYLRNMFGTGPCVELRADHAFEGDASVGEINQVVNVGELLRFLKGGGAAVTVVDKHCEKDLK